MVTVKLDGYILGALTEKTALWLKVLAGALCRKKLRLLSAVGERLITVQQEYFVTGNGSGLLSTWFPRAKYGVQLNAGVPLLWYT